MTALLFPLGITFFSRESRSLTCELKKKWEETRVIPQNGKLDSSPRALCWRKHLRTVSAKPLHTNLDCSSWASGGKSGSSGVCSPSACFSGNTSISASSRPCPLCASAVSMKVPKELERFLPANRGG